ncbi:NAD(P)H-hydrate dehydratase [Blastomonas natatoria]|uniref:NAD(P)H-hydrate dehydratase n=1 Tax=Blastomonas natatoria TaxID=34015 RepID=UPI001FCA40CA|nr:NAD(P)H-hydrate dehydratase [Blastomonas natatoria]
MADRGAALLTVAEMVAAEQAMFESGVSVDALMQRAGEGAGQMIWRIGGTTPTLVLCGPGNNGGDGYVIAEFLRARGVQVTVAALSDPRTDAARNARARYHGEVMAFEDARPATQVVDCLFGSGLTRPLESALWEKFAALVHQAQRSFAVDLPSGADADRAVWLNEPLHFDHVLALGAWKHAHLLEPVASDCGALSLVEIGVGTKAAKVRRIERPGIAPPDARSHKYRRGLVAVLVGEMSGAALLSAHGAQGAAAGYVKLIGPGDAPPQLPADIVWQRADGSGAVAEALQDPRIGSVVVGPGLGRGDTASNLLMLALACPHPLIIDADALHLLPEKFGSLKGRGAPVLLTPHQGEFEALGGETGSDAMNKLARTAALAEKLDVFVLYKGSDTVIAAPDGRAVIADRRCSWLSVAGTGDVLAGCMAARLAGHAQPFDAMAEAVWLHDRAAKIAGPAFSALQLATALRQALEACLER